MANREASPQGHNAMLPAGGDHRAPWAYLETGPPQPPKPRELNIFSHPEFVRSGKENHVGIDHFCFLVDATSVDDVGAALQQAGIHIVKGPEQRRDGMALFVHDPDGVRVELQLKRSTTA